jgi:hypothetical protein
VGSGKREGGKRKNAWTMAAVGTVILTYCRSTV